MLVLAPDAIPKRLFHHVPADVDEGVGDAGGGAFEGEEHLALQPAFVEVRQDVNPVNDDRHLGSPRGPAPDDARLAGVGVNEVRTPLAEKLHARGVGLPVVQRMDGPSQRGQAHRHDAPVELLAQRLVVFVAMHQQHVVSQGGLAVAGIEGVFVRAAADEPGDEVCNAHDEWLSFRRRGGFQRAVQELSRQTLPQRNAMPVGCRVRTRFL